MKPNAYLNLLKFPPLIVALLLQIAPFCRTVFVNPGFFQSSFSIVFKWVAGAGMTLGAIDAVSGASATITGLRPYVGTTQIGPVSLTPSIPAGAGNITLRIMVANPGVNPEQAYWDCTPLPTSLTINTAVGASGYITNVPGQLTVAGVYNVTLKAGNTLYGFITTNATITVTNTSIGSPPNINTPPASQTVNAGSSATLSVAATGTGTLAYQWRKGGVNVGINSASLTFNPVTAEHAGSYDVIVSNSSGSVTSSPPAVLTVVVPPMIQTPPASLSAYEGGTAALTVTANSSVPVTYEWRKGTTAIGTDSPTLSINPVTAGSAGSYDVIVSNQAGSVTSAPPALLTVVPPAAMQLELPPGQPPEGPRTVRWQALAGKSYTLQRRDNFAPDTWHDVGTTNVTVSGPVQMTDDTAGETNLRFYQLRTQ